jgi:hypothetical protein
MNYPIKTKLPLFICLIICFIGYAVAQIDAETPIADYIFETIEVPGIDFLEIAASNDFGDYAGNTRNPDGEKIVGFTLIDGVFRRYDFPGSVNTFFYGLDNTGKAVGHYKDADGLYHGVILEDGELHQYDFPGASETNIYGISDETGALSGNAVDTEGVSHAFSGDLKITFPGAVQTYGDFVNAAGAVVGSYIDTDGLFHGFIRNPDGSFNTIDLPKTPNLAYLFVNTITDLGVIGFRAKAVNDILRSYILLPDGTLYEVRFPDSVSTVVRNVNQDGSIIGYYDSTDGRRLGFVGRPATPLSGRGFGNVFSMHLFKGLNMLSVPLKPTAHMTARTLALKTSATVVITLDPADKKFVGWTPDAPGTGFPIEGGKGYIVNLLKSRDVVFTGTAWTDQMQTAAAPRAGTSSQTWAFVVTGRLNGSPASEWLASTVENPAFDGYRVVVRNLRTNSRITASVDGDYFAAATADLSRRSVVEVGDVIELHVVGPDGNVESQTVRFNVTPEHLAIAVLSVRLDGIGKPQQNQLLQNYPNPFNPETWIPYQLSDDGAVSVSVFDSTGALVRTLSLGVQSAGFYNSRGRAAYWDGRNRHGELVASGTYFYELSTPSFRQIRRMVIIK